MHKLFYNGMRVVHHKRDILSIKFLMNMPRFEYTDSRFCYYKMRRTTNIASILVVPLQGDIGLEIHVISVALLFTKNQKESGGKSK